MAGRIDPKAYQERLDRMTEVFADMVRHADAVSRTRCPYRDRYDRCTAQFGCRFKLRTDEGDDALPVCTNDGRLDYRTAWETEPESASAMGERLRGQRRR